MLWAISQYNCRYQNISSKKKPRFIKEAKYKQLVDELYKTNISNDLEENKQLKTNMQC